MGSFFKSLVGWRPTASTFNKLGAFVNWGVIGAALASVITRHAPTVTIDLSSVSGAVTTAAVLGISEAYRRSHHGEAAP